MCSTIRLAKTGPRALVLDRLKKRHGSHRFTLPASYRSHLFMDKSSTAFRLFLKVLVLVLRVLVSTSTESSLDTRSFIQKHIIKKRGRCRELLASKEVADCAPSLSVLVYPIGNRCGCLGEDLPHKGASRTFQRTWRMFMDRGRYTSCTVPRAGSSASRTKRQRLAIRRTLCIPSPPYT